MKILKIVFFLIIAYVGIVVLFESLLGYFQPDAGDTMVISTFDPDGTTHDRVVARLSSGEQLFVAVNHWPRAWYRRLLENPRVRITFSGESGDYEVVEISGSEYDRINSEHSLGFLFRFLTGFPERKLLRLEPSQP